MTRVKETKVAGHPIEPTRLGRASRRIRLQTIVWLRWLAVAGQTATILFVAFGLNFPLPLLACGLLVSTPTTTAQQPNPDGTVSIDTYWLRSSGAKE